MNEPRHTQVTPAGLKGQRARSGNGASAPAASVSARYFLESGSFPGTKGPANKGAKNKWRPLAILALDARGLNSNQALPLYEAALNQLRNTSGFNRNNFVERSKKKLRKRVKYSKLISLLRFPASWTIPGS